MTIDRNNNQMGSEISLPKEAVLAALRAYMQDNSLEWEDFDGDGIDYRKMMELALKASQQPIIPFALNKVVPTREHIIAFKQASRKCVDDYDDDMSPEYRGLEAVFRLLCQAPTVPNDVSWLVANWRQDAANNRAEAKRLESLPGKCSKEIRILAAQQRDAARENDERADQLEAALAAAPAKLNGVEGLVAGIICEAPHTDAEWTDYGHTLPPGTKLYTHPPAAGVDEAMVERAKGAQALKVATCRVVGPNGEVGQWSECSEEWKLPNLIKGWKYEYAYKVVPNLL